MSGLIRCMGGRFCDHALGSCTATNKAYLASPEGRNSRAAVIETAIERFLCARNSGAWNSSQMAQAVVDEIDGKPSQDSTH